jgi:hypothetical protein
LDGEQQQLQVGSGLRPAAGRCAGQRRQDHPGHRRAAAGGGVDVGADAGERGFVQRHDRFDAGRAGPAPADFAQRLAVAVLEQDVLGEAGALGEDALVVRRGGEAGPGPALAGRGREDRLQPRRRGVQAQQFVR